MTAQLTAPANLAHPTVLRELHWHLLGHPVRSRVGLALVCRDSAACFDELVGALDRNLAAARREPVLGSSVSLRTIMQNQLKLEVQNKELQEELQRLKRKEQKRAERHKSKKKEAKKFKQKAMSLEARLQVAEEETAEERAQRTAAERAHELELDSLRRTNRLEMRQAAAAASDATVQEEEKEEEEPPRTDLSGITLTLRDKLPGGSHGFSLAASACVTYLKTYGGASAKKCVELLAKLLGAFGVTVVNIPADHEGVTKNAVVMSQELEMTALAVEILRLRRPDWKYPAVLPEVSPAEGMTACPTSPHKLPQAGSVSAGRGYQEWKTWWDNECPWEELTPVPAQWPPEAPRDSVAGRAAWKKSECLGLFLKIDGTNKHDLRGQEVVLVGGPGLTKDGCGSGRSLIIEEHFGRGGAQAGLSTLRRGVQELRARLVFFGVAEPDLPDEVDFIVLGTDNTGSMTSWEKGLAGLWELVCLVHFVLLQCILFIAAYHSTNDSTSLYSTTTGTTSTTI